MKKAVYTVLFASSMAIVSCGAAAEVKPTETNVAVPETNEEIAGEEAIVSKYNYDKDWESIKKAILAKDISELDLWINGTQVDAESIIDNCDIDFVKAALKKSTYADLEPLEMDGEIFLVFFVGDFGKDEEGAEVGSSFTIYMSQGDPYLRIEHILAAG